ncbi:hypothetical protein HPP92_009906 [Vanilla planifolia]|uniref:Uncharacterized protein n=1 Tax=Vanilla planifolia TaxID=51239 RepID=A0A835V1C0_VANPL|nr:hypothetical protein HPP92_009906 [Vanilla planifolia]
MSYIGRAIVRPDLRLSRVVQLAFLRRLLRILWRHVIACSYSPAVMSASSVGDRSMYHRLGEEGEEERGIETCVMDPPLPPSPPLRKSAEESSDDLVSLKISLLGDCRIGKTSFMVKYVGKDEEHRGLQLTGLNLMDKVFSVRGTRIAFSIWDVAGDLRFSGQVPFACKGAMAILIMFDLTNRSTLSNAKDWYRQARTWNKMGIPILVGTKFDDFVQLPLDMQWTVVHEVWDRREEDISYFDLQETPPRTKERLPTYTKETNQIENSNKEPTNYVEDNEKLMWRKHSQSADSYYEVRPECTDVPETRFKIKPGITLSIRRWRAAFSTEGYLDVGSILSRIQRGGIHPSIRGEVWEFLLGCFDPNSTFEEREQLRQHRRAIYAQWKEECRQMDSHVGSGIIITAPIITENGEPIKDPLVLSQAVPSSNLVIGFGSKGESIVEPEGHITDKKIIL